MTVFRPYVEKVMSTFIDINNIARDLEEENRLLKAESNKLQRENRGLKKQLKTLGRKEKRAESKWLR